MRAAAGEVARVVVGVELEVRDAWREAVWREGFDERRCLEDECFEITKFLVGSFKEIEVDLVQCFVVVFFVVGFQIVVKIAVVAVDEVKVEPFISLQLWLLGLDGQDLQVREGRQDTREDLVLCECLPHIDMQKVQAFSGDGAGLEDDLDGVEHCTIEAQPHFGVPIEEISQSARQLLQPFLFRLLMAVAVVTMLVVSVAERWVEARRHSGMLELQRRVEMARVCMRDSEVL